MPNPTIGNESQFTPSYAWGGGFSSFDIATEQETLIAGKNPTLTSNAQFTPSYSWGNGYSSFDIATEQETLITGKNPTLTATRTQKIQQEKTIVSQFQSYGKKFLKTPQDYAAYDGSGITPAGIDAYLIPLNSDIETTVNSFNMAGTGNTNKTSFGVNVISSGLSAAVGISGISAITPFSDAILSQAGLLDPTFATAPLQLLNNKIGFQGTGISVPYPDFRTRKFNIRNASFGELANTVVLRRADGLSALTRATSGAPGVYASLAATIGPYNIFNLDATYGWGNHDSPTAIRSDFTLRSNIASTWDFKKLRILQKQLKDTSGFAKKLVTALKQTPNVLERVIPFRGDRVNVIDFNQRTWKDIYRWLPEKAADDSKFENFAKKTANVLGINPYGTTKDFIKFFFTGPKLHAGDKEMADDVIVFRAILTSFSDQFTPTWSPVNIIGRPDTNYHYGGYARSVDLGFTIYATDRDELRFIYRKLNALAGYTAPEYVDSYALKGSWIRVTIGDYFLSQPAIIDSLSYTFVDSDTTWEINIEQDPYMKQVTHKVDVSLGLSMITDYLPQKGGSFYTLASDDAISSTGRPAYTDRHGWLNDTKTALRIGRATPGEQKQEQEL